MLLKGSRRINKIVPIPHPMTWVVCSKAHTKWDLKQHCWQKPKRGVKIQPCLHSDYTLSPFRSTRVAHTKQGCIGNIKPLHWVAAVAEIKIPSCENTELKHSPFKAWSRSVYSHTCYANCQEFLPCLFLPFQSIHLHFFQNLCWFLLCWLWLTHGPCVGPQNEIGHPAGCRFPCWVPAEYK